MQHLNIRGKLFLIFFVLAVPLLLVIAFSYLDRYQNRTELILVERIDTARLAANIFTLFMQDMGRTMEPYGQDVIEETSSPQDAMALLQPPLDIYPAEMIAVASLDGAIIGATDEAMVGRSLAGNEAFDPVAAGDRELAVSALQVERDPKGFYVAQAVRAADGVLRGVIIAFITTSGLHEALPVAPEQGGAVITDSRGWLVYSKQFPELVERGSFWGDFEMVQRALAGEAVTSTDFIHPATGESRMRAQIPIEEFGWTAGSGIDADEALAPIRRSLFFSILATVIILLIALSLSALIARRITGPLAILVGKAQAIGAGRFDEPVDIKTGDEIEDLANSLDAARIDLRETEVRAREEARLSAALNDINAAINSTLEFDEIMRRVVVDSAKAVGCETAAVDLREDNYWVIKYAYGMPLELIGMRFSDEEAKHATLAARLREPIIVNDAYSDERLHQRLVREYEIRSFITVPLVAREEIIGALSFHYHSAATAFAETQVDFASKVAASVSLALENARLFEQARSELETSDLLLKAADALAVSIDLQEVLNRLADIIIEATGRERAVVSLFDKENSELVLAASRGRATFPPGMRISLTQLAPQVRQSMLEKRPIVVDYDAPDMPEESKKRAETVDSRLSFSVPLIFRGEVIGHIGLDEPGVRREFTQREVEIIEGIAAQAAVAIENARLFEVERYISNTLQDALLMIPEHIDRLEYGHLYRSATETARVGGDFYDLFELEHDRVGIIIGDVSGKGIEAATLTAVVRNTIRAYALEGYSVAEVMAKTNDAVKVVSGQSSFITAIFAVLEPATGTLTYCSAGHPPAIIKRKSHETELLSTYSPMIGAFTGLKYEESATRLGTDDILALYTDGAIEARCDGKFFGEERLVNLISELEPASAKELPRLIFDEVMRCTGGTLSDDLALLAISIGLGRSSK